MKFEKPKEIASARSFKQPDVFLLSTIPEISNHVILRFAFRIDTIVDGARYSAGWNQDEKQPDPVFYFAAMLSVLKHIEKNSKRKKK